MARPPDREHQESARQQFHCAAHHPEADDYEQNADWYAANLAPGDNQPQTEQRVTRGAEDQKYGKCDIQIHRFQGRFNEILKWILRRVSV